MRYRAIVLDLDGTLVNTTGALTRGLNETLLQLGRSSLSAAQVRRHRDYGLRALLRAACHLTGPALSDAELNAALIGFRARYDHWLLDLSSLNPGVVPALSALRDRGVRQSVLTNKPSSPALRLIEAYELAPYLDFVVAGDMELPHKPDPSGLLELLDQMNIPLAEAVFVGSSRVDLHTARNAELAAALCNPTVAKARLLAMGADYVLDDIAQLIALATGELSAQPL